MKDNRTIILILIIVFLISLSTCQSFEKIFSGKYSNRFYPNVFEIYSDSTFIYKSMMGSIIEKYSEGKWKRLDKNTIILNSTIQNNNIPIQVNVIPDNKNKRTICVNLNVPGQSVKDYVCYPIFNDNIFPSMNPGDRGSYCIYSEVSIHSIHFQIQKIPLTLKCLGPRQPEYYDIYSKSVTINSKIGDSIIIKLQIPDSLFSYRIFRDTKLKISGENLIFKDIENGNKTNKLHLN